jgi:hypothetical protein
VPITFSAALGEESGSTIQVPNEVLAQLGSTRKRLPVRVQINGIELRTTLAVYGGRTFIGIRREMREAMRIQSGETIQIHLAADTEPRVVEVPQELAQVLAADAEAQAKFEALSFTNRKEYVEWATGARRAETRQQRLAAVADMLKSGRRTPMGR